MHPRPGGRYPRRPFRVVQCRTLQNGLPHGLELPLWTADADHQRHPLQLLGSRNAHVQARPRPHGGRRFCDRGLFRVDPQLPPLLMALDLPLRGIARGVQVLPARCRSGSRVSDAPRGLGRGHAASSPCDVVAHGTFGLSERCPVVVAHLVQRLGAVRGDDARRPDQALSAVRGHRRECRRRVPAALHRPPADRERVLRHDPPEAPGAFRRATARCAARPGCGVRRSALHGSRSV